MTCCAGSVSRGGVNVNRRHPLEYTDVEESPSKRQAFEATTASKAHNMDSAINILDSSVRDFSPLANLTSPLNAAINSIGKALGSRSSMHQKIYEILNASSFLSDVGRGIYFRIHE